MNGTSRGFSNSRGAFGYGIPAIKLDSHSDADAVPSVAAAAFRSSSGEGPNLRNSPLNFGLSGDFCAFIVVVNLCSTPNQYTLAIEGIPDSITTVRHIADANYVVQITSDAAGRRISDMIGGYGSSVLQIGCKGWNDDLTYADGRVPACCGMSCGCTENSQCSSGCSCQYQTVNPYPPHHRCLKNSNETVS